jgi:hypothetical protein
MKNQIRQGCCWLLLIILGMLCGSPAYANGGRAAGDQFKMNINISGTVVATGSCTFTHKDSSGWDLIDFGNVRYSTVKGFVLEGTYRQNMDGAMTCTGDTEGTAEMTLTPLGNGDTVEFNGHKLIAVTMSGSSGSSSSKNLGIALLVNGNVQDVATPFQIDIASPPGLEVELVQTGAADTVASGTKFIASAALTMTFQ